MLCYVKLCHVQRLYLKINCTVRKMHKVCIVKEEYVKYNMQSAFNTTYLTYLIWISCSLVIGQLVLITSKFNRIFHASKYYVETRTTIYVTNRENGNKNWQRRVMIHIFFSFFFSKNHSALSSSFFPVEERGASLLSR